MINILKTLFVILTALSLYSCSLFNTVRVTPLSSPYLTQKVKPTYYITDTYGDIIMSLIRTREALTICNMKLDAIKKLNDKNQDL
tara:strand:+ start:266 stop:520 length:255 start_codon:yes stop_codon:yes gene_type:complete